jgi:hypothetical protein
MQINRARSIPQIGKTIKGENSGEKKRPRISRTAATMLSFSRVLAECGAFLSEKIRIFCVAARRDFSLSNDGWDGILAIRSQGGAPSMPI